MRKQYRGGAPQLTLATVMTAGTMSFSVTGDTTNWPAGGSDPFVVDIDYNNGTAEKVLVASRSGAIFTVTPTIGRGYDGTTASSHSIGAVIRHVVDAVTLDEANAHVNDETRDDHPQYLTTERHDDPARHAVGTTIARGSPGASRPGDNTSSGSSTAVAAADHVHEREDWGLLGDVTDGLIGQGSAPGNSGRVADANHRHAVGTPGTPIASSPGDAGGAGISTTPARSDHVHPRENTFGLTQVEDKNDGDTPTLVASSATVVATYTITTAAPRTIEISAYFLVRNAAIDGGSFAGYARIRMNGSNMFGATRRFNSFPMATACLPVSFSTKTNQPAGTYTFEIHVTMDPGVPDVVALGRDLNVFTFGGP